MEAAKIRTVVVHSGQAHHHLYVAPGCETAEVRTDVCRPLRSTEALYTRGPRSGHHERALSHTVAQISAGDTICLEERKHIVHVLLAMQTSGRQANVRVESGVPISVMFQTTLGFIEVKPVTDDTVINQELALV